MKPTAKLSADGWIALVLLASCGLLLRDLLRTESAGAFVTTTTLPIMLVLVLVILSLLLLAGAIMRGRPAGAGPEDRAGLARVAAMVVWIALYVAALPWAGYLLASGVFLVGAGLLYGNRRWSVILGVAVVLPGALLLFFEKVMIVLLPSSRLLG